LHPTHNDDDIMNPKTLLFSVVVLLGVVASRAARMFIMEQPSLEMAMLRANDAVTDEISRLRHHDGPHYLYRRQAEEPMAPLRRSGPAMYDPIPPTDLETAGSDSYHHGGYKPGIVGPVYTFVKTDPYAHVKWGVRHVAGKKYAHGR